MPAHITAGMKLEWAEPVDADEDDYEVGIFLTAILRWNILYKCGQTLLLFRCHEGWMTLPLVLQQHPSALLPSVGDSGKYVMPHQTLSVHFEL
jgi:hypothetical protein